MSSLGTITDALRHLYSRSTLRDVKQALSWIDTEFGDDSFRQNENLEVLSTWKSKLIFYFFLMKSY